MGIPKEISGLNNYSSPVLFSTTVPYEFDIWSAEIQVEDENGENISSKCHIVEVVFKMNPHETTALITFEAIDGKNVDFVYNLKEFVLCFTPINEDNPNKLELHLKRTER